MLFHLRNFRLELRDGVLGVSDFFFERGIFRLKLAHVIPHGWGGVGRAGGTGTLCVLTLGQITPRQTQESGEGEANKA